MVKTRDQWVAYLRDLIEKIDNSLDTAVGPVRDAFVNPSATVDADIDSELDRVRQIINIDNYNLMTESEFRGVLGNYLVEPLEGGKARGVVYFQTPVLNADVTIPRGFPVTTPSSTGYRIIFYTTEVKTMLSSVAANYLNSANGLYEIEVSVEAVVPREIGSIPARTITEMMRTLAGISRIENREVLTPGRNTETRAESITRLKQFVQSSGSYALREGIKFMALGYSSDVAVVGDGDDGFDKENGRVDVIIVGENLSTVNEYFRVGYAYLEDPSSGVVWIFENQPVTELLEVLVDSVDRTSWFSIQKDIGPYSNSMRGKDALYISNPSLLDPYLGKSVEVKVRFNNFVGTVQGVFDDPDNRVFGRDVVVREAEEVDVVVGVILTYVVGYDQSIVKATVKSSIIEFVNNLGISEGLEMSDVIFEIKSVPGVDNLVFTDFRRSLDPVGTVTDIVADLNEYFRTDAGLVSVS